MRRSLLLLPFSLASLACGGREEVPATDTAAAATAAAPAGLTESQFAGTWNVEALAAESDSVLFRFTDICGNGTCKGVVAGMTDTTVSTYRIDGDSVIGTAGPIMNADLKQQVVEQRVLRVVDGTATGSGTLKLADRDSVLLRLRFRATKASP